MHNSPTQAQNPPKFWLQGFLLNIENFSIDATKVTKESTFLRSYISCVLMNWLESCLILIIKECVAFLIKVFQLVLKSCDHCGCCANVESASDSEPWEKFWIQIVNQREIWSHMNYVKICKLLKVHFVTIAYSFLKLYTKKKLINSKNLQQNYAMWCVLVMHSLLYFVHNRSMCCTYKTLLNVYYSTNLAIILLKQMNLRVTHILLKLHTFCSTIKILHFFGECWLMRLWVSKFPFKMLYLLVWLWC